MTRKRPEETKICFGKLRECPKPPNSANQLSREFVAASWPNVGTGGASIRDMYERLTATAKQEEVASADAPKTNGQVNGVVVNQE